MKDDLSRRAFMKKTTGATTMAGSAGLAGGAAAVNRTPGSTSLEHDPDLYSGENTISLTHDLPMYCGHEHWGAIYSLGQFKGGFIADIVQGALPRTPTNLLHLFLDPYFGGWVRASGVNPNKVLRERVGCDDPVAEFRERPVEIWRACLDMVADQCLTGAFQCIRRGVMTLYGVDPVHIADDEIVALNSAVESNYADLFAWYETAMKRAHFGGLARPVHPEFFAQEESEQTAARERQFTQTLMRIDPLLELWKPHSERRAAMSAIVDIDPGDAASWRAFLDGFFDLGKANNNVGIKQLQAYSRSLDFKVRDDNAVKFRGELTRDEEICFEDWVVHECCKRAHDLGWPHQVHVGTHNLSHSSPLPLEALARRYPAQSLVLLHCWPFVEESGYLAKMRHNVYLDPCWQPILSPDFLEQSFKTWLRYIPVSKLTVSNDATSVEMAVGASLYAREALDEGLKSAAKNANVKDHALRSMASAILAGNAQKLYGAV
jgi:hypothetical protein